MYNILIFFSLVYIIYFNSLKLFKKLIHCVVKVSTDINDT